MSGINTNLNDLHFSANGLGVVLKTKYGGLRFSTEEFGYYQSLFTIADSHNLGKLPINSAQLNCFVVRADIPWPAVEKILAVALKHRVDGEENAIYFYQWLIICKLVAYYQETKKPVNDKVFKSLHTGKFRIPFADYHLSQARNAFVAGSYYEKFKVSVGPWLLVGEGFQDQHVKFRINTLSTLINESEVPKVPTDDDSDKKSSGHYREKFSVERRYSEFETLATILQKNHKYVVVPPLPVKNWTLLAPTETIANQRAIEFQMFLSDLASHPVLKYSFELKAFLECSSQGFKAFVDLYSHMQDGKLDYSASPSSNNMNELLTKLLADSASAVTTSATAFFSTMWDSVKKNVPILATPPVTRPPSNEHDAAFTKTALFLEGVMSLGRKMEAIVTNEQGYFSELAKIAQGCKSMAEFETIPELTRVLNACHMSLGAISKSQLQYNDSQHLRAEIPLLYMGRYKDSYQTVLAQRSKLEEEQHTAARAEMAAQLNVEKAHAALVAAGGSGHLASSSKSPEHPHGHGNGKSVASPSTTTSATSPTDPPTSAAAGPAVGADGHALSPAEMKAHAAVRAFNQAKLDLAAAEDHFEHRRAAAEQMTASLRSESRRLEALERAQLMKCAKEFVVARMEAARSSVKQWEALKAELENTTT